MNINHRFYVPDGILEEEAARRITHLGIGAHQDDLEFMAFHGILECYHTEEKWFGGVTCSDGAGSPRDGKYAKYSDDLMKETRSEEQEMAAHLGRYGAMWQLGLPSRSIKDPSDTSLTEALVRILEVAQPSVVYTHNLADKHDSHVAVCLSVIDAVREVSPRVSIERLYGCEVWRSLDWMMDNDVLKLSLNVSGHENLAAALNGVFDSQIAGGKRYDLGVSGRRRANATFYESHSVDELDQVWFAMDLSRLVSDPECDPETLVMDSIDALKADVSTRIRLLQVNR